MALIQGGVRKAMATVKLSLKGAPENISFKSFVSALSNSLNILADLDLAISHEPKGSLDWFVTQLSTGSLSVTIESRSRVKGRNFGPEAAEALVIGLDKIEREGTSPPYLSEYGIKKAQSLTGLIGRDGIASIQVTDLERTADLSRIAFENIRQIIQVKKLALGSVEGAIETISIHGKPKFIIYQRRTRKAVTCQFDREKWFDKVRNIMGQRVIVSGMVHYNPKGEPLRVQLENIRQMRGKDELPTIQEISGSDPDFTGDLTTEEYIKRLRNG